MPLAFRNICVTPQDPVSDWGLEGIQTALERGDLSHWRRIAAEVRREPWGKVAEELADVLSYCHPYGVADVMGDILTSARAAEARSEEETVAAEVRAIVASSGMTAKEFAARMGTSPSRLSTYMTGKVNPSAALMVRMRNIQRRRTR
ncbi:MAG: helix-turn-helix domain-containing protein [Acidimicrobiales bacterium]